MFALGHGVGRNGRARRNRRALTKRDARSLVYEAVKVGRLVVPECCERCNVPQGCGADGRRLLQAHHADHSKPLDVEWLCVSCHTDDHKGKVRRPYEGRRKLKIAFYAERALYEAVVARARREGVTRTGVIEAALRAYLAED